MDEEAIYRIEDRLQLNDPRSAMELAEEYVDRHSLRSYVKNIL